jgi:hypothetical protein
MAKKKSTPTHTANGRAATTKPHRGRVKAVPEAALASAPASAPEPVRTPVITTSSATTATDARDAMLLREAAENPGVIEIPPAQITPQTITVVEIPMATLDPGGSASGQSLENDPAIMTVAIDRPGPHAWVQLFPDRTLRTVLLAHKQERNGSPDYYYVVPALQGMVRKDLKEVLALLVFDANNAGEAFLWLVSGSEWSPYHNAIQRVLAKGEVFLRNHLFRFLSPEKRARVCPVQVRERTPDDPAPLLPSRPVSQLLPEALGPGRLITSTSHQVYVQLTAGGALK